MTGDSGLPAETGKTRGHTIGWWAPLYDMLGWIGTFGRLPRLRRETVEIAGLNPGESVLDVGCGTGALTRLAARRVAPDGKAIGIDASPQMIATAAKKRAEAANLEFRLAPIERLPFDPGSFDVVLSSLMLHHLPDDLKRQGLLEVRRVLKPGGRLVVVELSGHGILGHLPGHHLPRTYSDQLAALIAEAGFASVGEVATGHRNLCFMRAYVVNRPVGETRKDERA